MNLYNYNVPWNATNSITPSYAQIYLDYNSCQLAACQSIEHNVLWQQVILYIPTSRNIKLTSLRILALIILAKFQVYIYCTVELKPFVPRFEKSKKPKLIW